MSAPTRTLLNTTSICLQCRLRLRQRLQTRTGVSVRNVTSLASESGNPNDDLAFLPPRWQRAPSAMRAPYRTRPKEDVDTFEVNEDPGKLDEALNKMLGREGETMMSEAVKWQVVTHKSFDHGRRGYNDKLAFMGKRIVELQTSLALLNAPKPSQAAGAIQALDKYGRMPFQHPALENLESITPAIKNQVLDKRRLAQLAMRYGLDTVIRWKPKQITRLQASGIDTVLAHTIFAIVGAVALQKGGEVANQIVREKILQGLGI